MHAVRYTVRKLYSYFCSIHESSYTANPSQTLSQSLTFSPLVHVCVQSRRSTFKSLTKRLWRPGLPCKDPDPGNRVLVSVAQARASTQRLVVLSSGRCTSISIMKWREVQARPSFTTIICSSSSTSSTLIRSNSRSRRWRSSVHLCTEVWACMSGGVLVRFVSWYFRACHTSRVTSFRTHIWLSASTSVALLTYTSVSICIGISNYA